MFKDLSIQKKLYAGFGAIVALLLVLLFTAYYHFNQLTEANRWDRHTLQLLLQSNELEAGIRDVQAQFRGYVLTGNEKLLQSIGQGESAMRADLLQLKTLSTDNPVQQERLRKIEPLLDNWLKNVVQPMIEKRRNMQATPGALEQLSRDPMIMAGITEIAAAHDLLSDFNAEENRLLAERSAQANTARQNMMLLLSLGGLAAVLTALLIAVSLARSILRPLDHLTAALNRMASGDQAARAEVLSQDDLGQVTAQFNAMAQTLQDAQARERQSIDELKRKVDLLLDVVSRAANGDLTGRVTVFGDDAIGRLGSGLATMFDNLRILLDRVQKAGIQVATSTTEIAASARQQESTGVEQAQTSIEVLSTTKEISANTAQLVKAMQEVNQVAEDTTSATTDALGNLRRMDHSMQRMVSATESINAKLAALSEKASNINAVLTTITKVADQTNILSLNAAIEAEKAGEAGRGFSVVATEIRRLADQTSVATWDIEQMLKEMQSAVSASVMGMDKFSEDIRRSVEEARQVSDGLTVAIEQVQKLPPRFDMVLEGMQSQAVGASQITETMTQLNDATQQAVDALKATSEAVQQLQYAAKDLQAGVSSFAVNM
ncbi:methyl-accepting chemotaxis protein [Noviherbaspirillum malthae]|uniref:methyl-accepting chemotaxis protein n=1 Tax=Noviherbaspirillum malthae TaxID=1260987 RepID=UPI0018902C7F|nr:methyl-accepting chemotaxis protein [Noviherbaspirillum malthae]